MENAIDEIKKRYLDVDACDFTRSLFGDEWDTIKKMKRSVVVYGAGSAGKELAECLLLHGVSIKCFCDRNEDLIGSKLLGVEVISPTALCDSYKDCQVVIGVQRYKQPVLDWLIFNNFRFISYINDDDQFYYYLQFPRWKIDFSRMLVDSDLIVSGYEMMSDPKSKEIYLTRLALLASYADYSSYLALCELSDFPIQYRKNELKYSSNFENEMYFNNDLVDVRKILNLVDCGSYDGDSYKEYVKALSTEGLEYEHVYCFEPDPHNFMKLEQNLMGNRNVRLFNLGVWDKREILKFAGSDIMFRTESGVVQDCDLVIEKQVSNYEIQADSIDNTIQSKVDCIKMDVEGSESNALIGSSRIISMHKPILIISAYHKKNDLYYLPALIKKLRSDYRIYVRHFSFSLSETVLIAI